MINRRFQNGRTIINDTWNGCKADDTVHAMSVTKSIVCLLVGIAIEQGLIQKVTLKSLLTLTAPYKYMLLPMPKPQRLFCSVQRAFHVLEDAFASVFPFSAILFCNVIDMPAIESILISLFIVRVETQSSSASCFAAIFSCLNKKSTI